MLRPKSSTLSPIRAIEAILSSPSSDARYMRSSDSTHPGEEWISRAPVAAGAALGGVGILDRRPDALRGRRHIEMCDAERRERIHDRVAWSGRGCSRP